MDADMSYDDLMRGLSGMDDSAEEYVMAEEYADGTRAEVFASPQMRRTMQLTGTTYRINLAQTPIKVMSSRLEVASVTVPGNDAATAAIERLWEENELDSELPGAIKKACTYGDAYLVVCPAQEPGSVDMWVRSPLTTRIIYSADNPRKKDFAIFHWCEGATHRSNLLYADRTEKYITLPGKDGREESDWVEYEVDGEPWPLPNPDGIDEVPVFHLRTDRPYGRPVHKDAYGPQDLITKLVISHASVVDYQVAPQRYALSEPAVDSDDDSGIDFGLTDADAAQVDVSDPTSSLKSGPGELWYLQGVKGVGQFEPADPARLMDPITMYVRLMAQVCDIPLHYFDPSGNQPSGESRRVANEPLMKVVGLLKVAFGGPLKQAFQLALKLAGFGADLPVDVRWVPNETPDGLEAWQTINTKIQAGVPVRQALLEAGYTTEQVDEWLSASADEDLMRRIVALRELGSATQSLGTAVGFGVITVDQVQRAVAALLGEEPVAVEEQFRGAPPIDSTRAAKPEAVIDQPAMQ